MTTQRLFHATAALTMFLSAYAAHAQFTSAIEGTVTDPTSAVVPNATVTIRNLETGATRGTTTSSSGAFRLTSLPAAAFELTVTAAGFKTSVFDHVLVQVAETKNINVTLEVGTSDTHITVTAEVPQVETADARVSGLMDNKQVEDLPLTGRNFFTLVVLTPGVTGLPSGGGQSYAQSTGDIFTAEYGPSLNANGERGAGNNFMVDSASTNNVAHGGVTVFSPNAESVQEVRVLTNNFSAEYGRNSSVTVNVVTKQGTNSWHGSASEYHTNNDLSARTYFQDSVPVFRRNEYAGSLGGPIWKNHTFFFGSFDGLQSGVGTAGLATIATPQFIQFMQANHPDNISTQLWTKYPANATAPTSGISTAGNQTGIDCSGLASPSTPISTPVGTLPCNFPIYGNAYSSTAIPRNGTQWNTRVDHLLNNQKDRIYGNFYKTTLDSVLFNSPSVYPAFTEPQHYYSLYFNLNETHVFSPSVVNEMGASLTRVYGNNLCDPCGVPGISINGIAGFGQGWGPGQYVQNIYEWRDVVSFNRGAHQIKAGAKIEHNDDYDDFGRIPLRPNYYFASVFDFANDIPYSQSNVGINPSTGQRPASAVGYISDRDSNTAAFVQDDWKVKPNLSLNLGLRWELMGNIYERFDKQTNILFQGGNDYTSRIVNAKVDLTPNHKLLDHSPSTWAPRVGVAWDPTKSGKMSIRAGAGIFYDRLAEGPASTTIDNPPLTALVSAQVNTPTKPVFGLGTNTDPFNFPYPTGIQYGLNQKNGLLSGLASINGVDRNLQPATSYNAFFGIQRSLGKDWVVEVDYIGSLARHLYIMYDVNRFDGDLIQNGGNLTRLNTAFGPMQYAQARVNSAYNGGTTSVKKRFSRGVMVAAAYTLGKVLDGTDIGGGGNEYSGVNIADVNNLAREKALAVFDVRNRLSLSTIWDLPGPHSGLMHAVLGGWQLSNITILQSGTPFSVFCTTPFEPVFNVSGKVVGNTGCDYNADGNNFDYPNTPAFGNTLHGLSRINYINGLFTASQFPAPPLGQEGNLGRNTFRGPGFANTDLSMGKVVRIPWFVGDSGAQLRVRMEFFNVFNRVNLTQVDGNMSDGTFGQATSAYPGRDIQGSIKISF